MWGSCVLYLSPDMQGRGIVYLHFMLQACQVTQQKELKQILELQQLYLRGKKGPGEEAEQGFLTVAHSLTQLHQLHEREPSVIVKDRDTLAGYALVMTRDCKDIIPVLVPMFRHLERLCFGGQPLNNYPYYVMGQVCVAKEYRGRGVFDMLYHKHRELFRDSYRFVITEISTRNLRSVRAHERVGFRTVDIYRDETDEWDVALWDWE